MASRLRVAASLWQAEHPDVVSLSVPDMQPSAVVVGAGPGIGLAVARRFAREGFAVGLIARRQEALDGYVLELLGEHDVVLGVAADAADPIALEGAWAAVVDALGDPDVLVYNAMGARPLGAPTTLELADLSATLAVNVGGALMAAQLAAPAMRAAGRGTMVLTGGGLAHEPMAGASALSIGKAGMRSLTFCLAQELAPEGIHVATVTVCGRVEPGTHFDPDRIADEYWRLHTEPSTAWTTEVTYR
jgi:NAD(P)-dependent dehydrogenase (short-subunit alcohol dehydrogenase family)